MPAGDDDQDRYGSIIADFRAAMTMLKCASSQRALRVGISMAQLHILFTLQRNGDMTMSRLAEVLDVSLSSATGLIDRIEERGFVERTRVPEDRRMVVIRVTPAGHRMLGEVDALSDDLLRTVLERLDHRRLPGVAEAVQLLRASLAATIDDPPDGYPASTTAARSTATIRDA
ncbi:MAG: MarR family winged helix-turn-helix transcriptional regulator [Candidatus Limnocylindrales bacterium]